MNTIQETYKEKIQKVIVDWQSKDHKVFPSYTIAWETIGSLFIREINTLAWLKPNWNYVNKEFLPKITIAKLQEKSLYDWVECYFEEDLSNSIKMGIYKRILDDFESRKNIFESVEKTIKTLTQDAERCHLIINSTSNIVHAVSVAKHKAHCETLRQLKELVE